MKYIIFVVLIINFAHLSNSYATEFDDAIEFYNKGIEASERNEYEKSIIYFTKAINIQDDFAIALNSRGYSFYKTNNYYNAITDFNRTISYQNYFASKCIEITNKLKEEGDNDSTYSCLAGGNNYNPKILYKIKELRLKIKKLSDSRYFKTNNKAIITANKLLDKIDDDLITIQFMPNFGFAYYYRGLAYSKIFSWDKMLEDFEMAKLFEFNPDTPNEFHTSGKIQFLRTFELFAFERYVKIVERNPKMAIFLNGWLKRLSDHLR